MGGDFNRGGRGGNKRVGSSSNDKSHPPREGDWTCVKKNCGKNNFKIRTDCYRCSTPRSSGPKDLTQDSATNRKPPLPKASPTNQNNPLQKHSASDQKPLSEGDWICSQPSCGNTNSARRTCFKCKVPRPRSKRSQKDKEKRDGDWYCPKSTCNNLNFSYRTECHLCKEPHTAFSAESKKTDDGEIVLKMTTHKVKPKDVPEKINPSDKKSTGPPAKRSKFEIKEDESENEEASSDEEAEESEDDEEQNEGDSGNDDDDEDGEEEEDNDE